MPARLGIVTVALAAAAAAANTGASGIVEARIETMKSMSYAAKALGAVKIGVLPFSPDLARRAAADLKAGVRAARDQFPEGGGEGKTEALPVIWSERDRFDALFDDLAAAASRLEAAAEDEAAAMVAADAVAQTCKDCHETFRARKL